MLQLFLVLHPRHKLRYFKNAGWDDEQVATAENLVQARFESVYKALQCAESQSDGDNVRITATLLY